MLKLNLKTAPYWLDLPGKVKIKVKPITTAIMSAAQTMAVDQYRQLVESGQIDAQNDALRKGVGESLLIKALGQLAIIEWEGVLSADSDNPAPVNEQTVGDLMDIWLIAQDFMKAYVTQFSLLETEGNVSAPAANGTSAAVAPIAGSAA